MAMAPTIQLQAPPPARFLELEAEPPGLQVRRLGERASQSPQHNATPKGRANAREQNILLDHRRANLLCSNRLEITVTGVISGP